MDHERVQAHFVARSGADDQRLLTELAERAGITIVNLSILKTGKARAIRFSTLEAVCSPLTCQLGDILEFLPETGEGKQATARGAESDR